TAGGILYFGQSYFSETGLGPSAVTLYANLKSPDGSEPFNYVLNASYTSVSQDLTIHGKTYSVNVNLSNLSNLISSAGASDPILIYQLGANNVSKANEPFYQVTNSSTSTTATNSTYTAISSSGASLSNLTNWTPSSLAPKGGNINVVAGKSINISGTV